VRKGVVTLTNGDTIDKVDFILMGTGYAAPKKMPGVGDFEDIIQEVVENEGTVYEELTGVSEEGEYPIAILNFGPLYWVHAQEFDPITYFKSFEDAEEYARSTYEL
jgi:hypothetical protein